MCCPGSCGCPQWPDRCCMCLTKKTGVILTGMWTLLANMVIILPCVYALVRDDFWITVFQIVENWIVDNHWDSDVTSFALNFINSVSLHHQLFLIVVIAVCGLHCFNAFLLVIGAVLDRRLLFLPWLIQDLLTIGFVSLIFVFWAFFSFFVHVLVAILFPVLAGLTLGWWIYTWRNVKEVFHTLGVDLDQHQGTIYRKLPPGHHHNNHHHNNYASSAGSRTPVRSGHGGHGGGYMA